MLWQPTKLSQHGNGENAWVILTISLNDATIMDDAKSIRSLDGPAFWLLQWKETMASNEAEFSLSHSNVRKTNPRGCSVSKPTKDIPTLDFFESLWQNLWYILRSISMSSLLRGVPKGTFATLFSSIAKTLILMPPSQRGEDPEHCHPRCRIPPQISFELTSRSQRLHQRCDTPDSNI